MRYRRHKGTSEIGIKDSFSGLQSLRDHNVTLKPRGRAPAAGSEALPAVRLRPAAKRYPPCACGRQRSVTRRAVHWPSAEEMNGRIRNSGCGRARQGAGKGRVGLLRCGNSRPLSAIRLSGVLGKAARADLRRRNPAAAAAQGQAGRVRHLQPAVPHPDSRRTSHCAGPGPAGKTPAQPVLPHAAGRCARPHQGRRPDLRRLRQTGRVSQDLLHHADGRRKERQPRRGAHPLRRLPAPGAHLPQKTDCLAGLPGSAGVRRHRPGDHAGHLRHSRNFPSCFPI